MALIFPFTGFSFESPSSRDKGASKSLFVVEPPEDSAFKGGAIEDAQAILLAHDHLDVNNTSHPVGAYFERVSSKCLTAGMVAPVLVFAVSAALATFGDLKAPAGFYVVTTQSAKGDITLVLGHQNLKCALGLTSPRVIVFRSGDLPTELLVLSANFLDGRLLETHVEINLRKMWASPFTAPSKGSRNRSFFAFATSQSMSGKPQSSKTLETQYALMRATHSDPAKLTGLKIYSHETKLSDPPVILQILNNIEQESMRHLVVMLPQNLPLFWG